MSAEEGNKIELRSEEIQDILGQIPHWIIRWGTVLILFTILILLVGSWFFKYPEKKKADILVTTENPPAPLVARTNGKIVNFFGEENQFVKANTVLAEIENPASYSDVIDLKFDMADIRAALTSLGEGEAISLNNTYTLGEIQTAWAEFVNLYQDYYQFLELDYYEQTIRSKQEEIRRYRGLLERQRSESEIYKQDYELAEMQHQRMVDLLSDSTIAQLEEEGARQVKLQKQLAWENSKTEMSETEITISSLEQEVLENHLTKKDQDEQKQADIRESFEKLSAAIDEWEHKFLLVAPIDGVVTLPSYWSENQNVREGESVITVIPSDEGEIIGKINLSVQGAGRVKAGRRVNVQFANWPHLQYGMVRGEVITISQVPDEEGFYSVEVRFPEGLTTYYDFEIPFTQEMMGKAEIITDERRLLERIFDPIKSLFSEQRVSRESEPVSESE